MYENYNVIDVEVISSVKTYQIGIEDDNCENTTILHYTTGYNKMEDFDVLTDEDGEEITIDKHTMEKIIENL